MALSLFQEAQAARGLAAARALTGEQHDDERNLSPPISNNNAASIYSGLLPPTESAMRILAPHFIANQTAALLGIPISSLASSSPFFPTHPLFTAWAQSSTANSSPPTSPISPALKSVAKKIATNNNHIVSTTTADLGRKGAPRRRQISVRKDIISPPARFDTPAADAPISPPTSGSSPQSTGSAEHATMLTSSTKDPTRDKVFTCKTCKRSFGYKHVLQNHERTHTGEKPFECPECHKRFTRDHHLKTHMRLHTGEKPYKCEECDRRFVQVANLRRHLRVHTGERPYPCDMCEARFSDSNQLKAHLLIHKGKKPFQCELCHTKFRRPHHLAHHKCGITGPPTPVMSPAASDHKSASSDDSVPPFATPLDDDPMDCERRHRKSRDIRQIIRLPPQFVHLQPEQTEPEDLSMHSPRSSPPSPPASHDDDLDELDDAAALYISRQRHPDDSLY